MKRSFIQFLTRHFWFLFVFYRLVLRRKSYLHITGWVESMKRGYPCRKDGTEVPWMNYTVINLLSERLHDGLSVFEFGSGYSTFFYARLAKKVVSVEYDREWYNMMKDRLPDTVSLIYREKDVDGQYCRTVTEDNEPYDVVIVDGRDRVNCVKQAIGCLSKAGVVILDDSERMKYAEAISYATERGFRVLNMEGLKPSGGGIDKNAGGGYNRTTILYRDYNCLNI